MVPSWIANGPDLGYAGAISATTSMGQSTDSGVILEMTSDSHIARKETTSDGKSIDEKVL